MGFFSKDIKSEDLLLHGLHDTYHDEQQITKALPKMIERETNRDLAQGLKTHLDETTKEIERLDQVFKRLGKSPPLCRNVRASFSINARGGASATKWRASFIATNLAVAG